MFSTTTISIKPEQSKHIPLHILKQARWTLPEEGGLLLTTGFVSLLQIPDPLVTFRKAVL
jgi:hypothetical protein